MGHGTTNSVLINRQTEAEERALVNGVVEAIHKGTGKRPRGWLSPALSETTRTLDLLAAAGIDYVGNWVNDDQPYAMRVKSGRMLSMPYSAEINDIPALLGLHQSPEMFGQMIRDQFDVLYEDGAKTGRVMSICLHPFLIGHPHRSKYLDQALKHITSRQEVWLATGSEIADWYRKNYLDGFVGWASRSLGGRDKREKLRAMPTRSASQRGQNRHRSVTFCWSAASDCSAYPPGPFGMPFCAMACNCLACSMNASNWARAWRVAISTSSGVDFASAIFQKHSNIAVVLAMPNSRSFALYS